MLNFAVLSLGAADYSMLIWMKTFSVFGLVLVGSFAQQFGAQSVSSCPCTSKWNCCSLITPHVCRQVSRLLLLTSAALMLLLFQCPSVIFGIVLAVVSTSVEASLMPITALVQGK